MAKPGRLFELCRTRQDYFDLWERGEGRPVPAGGEAASDPGSFECIHRGPVKRTEKCQTCGNRDVTALVHWCELYTECTVHAHGLRDDTGKLAVCVACRERSDPAFTARPLVIDDPLCLGDVTVLTAAVRELADQYGRWFSSITVRSNHPYLFEGSEIRGESRDWQPPEGARVIRACYDADQTLDRRDVFATIHQSNQRPAHFLEAYCEGLSAALDLPPLRPRRWLEPSIRLTDEERGWYSQVREALGDDRPFWLVNAGSKSDYTAKQWYGYQDVVSRWRDLIAWVQVGAADDYHPPLRDVALNLVGQTDGRQLVRLVYHASGVLCGVTGLAHLSHWVERPRGDWSRPTVIVGGGREPPTWYQYPRQSVFSTLGRFGCCESGGCWRSRVVPLGDGSVNDSNLCELPVKDGEGWVPQCMRSVTSSEVAAEVFNREMDRQRLHALQILAQPD